MAGAECNPMTNLASVFKDEMARIARKEMRGQIEALKKSNAAFRADHIALKKRADALEKEVRRLLKALPKKEALAPADGAVVQRFSAKGLASHRARLNLSASDAGLVLGASGQSVYNWESGASRPQATHLETLAAFRKLGKREALELIAKLKA